MEANQQDQNGAPEQAPVTQEDMVAKLEDELKQEKNKYLYLYADFENYKKRAIKERSDVIKFGSEPLMRDLLLIKDNLERALLHTESTDALVEGLKMVESEMKKTLERFGLAEVKSVGEKFDPLLHEAVGQEPHDEEGAIVREHQKGYSLHGRLVRPAKVVIGIKK